MKKALDFNTYKRLQKMSYNDMNRWIGTFWGAAYETGLNESAKDVNLPDGVSTVISDDDLFILLTSVKGVGKNRACEIMDKMKQFGIDDSLWDDSERMVNK